MLGMSDFLNRCIETGCRDPHGVLYFHGVPVERFSAFNPARRTVLVGVRAYEKELGRKLFHFAPVMVEMPKERKWILDYWPDDSNRLNTAKELINIIEYTMKFAKDNNRFSDSTLWYLIQLVINFTRGDATYEDNSYAESIRNILKVSGYSFERLTNIMDTLKFNVSAVPYDIKPELESFLLTTLREWVLNEYAEDEKLVNKILDKIKEDYGYFEVVPKEE